MENPDPTPADPLAFTPVPRKINRADGWTADCQRAFIAALAATGSVRAACRVVDKSPNGAEQLRKAPGSESFNAAWDAALAIAAARAADRRAAGIEAARAEAAAWAPAPAPWSRAASRQPPPAAPAPTAAEQDEATREWLAVIFDKYLRKLEAERTARRAGHIAAADLYVRQMTHIEVMLELMGSGHGAGAAWLRDFRTDGVALLDIAETPLSRLLDSARRRKWAELGEPIGPDPIDPAWLNDHGAFSTEPCESTRGGVELTHEEQRAAFEARYAEAAAAHIEWEAAARREFEQRRDSAT